MWNIWSVFCFVALSEISAGSLSRALAFPLSMPHSAYLLRSNYPRAHHANRAYVGYNIDHRQRLRQHNGELAGGPSRTLVGRPYSYVALVTGFPNGTAAKIFEWAWANPRVSVGSPFAVLRLRRDGLFGGKELFKQLARATKGLPTPVCKWMRRLQDTTVTTPAPLACCLCSLFCLFWHASSSRNIREFTCNTGPREMFKSVNPSFALSGRCARQTFL